MEIGGLSGYDVDEADDDAGDRIMVAQLIEGFATLELVDEGHELGEHVSYGFQQWVLLENVGVAVLPRRVADA